MSHRENIKTTIPQIIEYWCKNSGKNKVSENDLKKYSCCWRCHSKKNIQRCHIVPDSLGGEDAPYNMVLLCSGCHAEAPNVSDPEIIWDWLCAYTRFEMPFALLFRGMKEYEFIYGASYEEDFEAIYNLIKNQSPKKHADDELSIVFKKLTEQAMQKASLHFGQPHFNIATVAGILRMILKEYAEKNSVNYFIQESLSDKFKYLSFDR